MLSSGLEPLLRGFLMRGPCWVQLVIGSDVVIGSSKEVKHGELRQKRVFVPISSIFLKSWHVYWSLSEKQNVTAEESLDSWSIGLEIMLNLTEDAPRGGDCLLSTSVTKDAEVFS